MLKEVPDPYYGGANGFENVLDILEDSTTNLLKKLQDEIERLEIKNKIEAVIKRKDKYHSILFPADVLMMQKFTILNPEIIFLLKRIGQSTRYVCKRS